MISFQNIIHCFVILVMILSPLNHAVEPADAAQPPALSGLVDNLLSQLAALFDPGATELVSVSSGGAQGNFDSHLALISADGRFVVFESVASNFAVDDTNGVSDIYLRSRQGSTTERVSISSSGVEGNSGSFHPSVSADGRFVVFESDADNLVDGDTNGMSDIFLRDRQEGLTLRISVTSGELGVEANGNSYRPSISADGRFVVFESTANNLAAGDGNGVSDIFVRDRQNNQTERVSISTNGSSGNGGSFYPCISADGRYVAFETSATNLVSGSSYGSSVLLRDRYKRETMRISISSSGAIANDNSYQPSISADGRFVAFTSYADNLVAGDNNGSRDVFVHDRKNNITGRISVSSDGSEGDYSSYNPFISPDGRYVAFDSSADNLVVDDNNGMSDVFLRDRQEGVTVRISVSSNENEGNSDSVEPSVSADGRLIVFTSYATDLVPGDDNNYTDIFLRNRCPDGSCGGPAAKPQLTASPAVLMADGTTTTTITLIGADAGHRVRLRSGRESADELGELVGTVSPEGRYTTTLKSTVPGYAVLTVEDMTDSVNLPVSLIVTFNDPSGKPLPPRPTGDVRINAVDSTLPLDGRYFKGLGAISKISVSVDWMATPPGYIEYEVNGVKGTVSAVTSPVQFELDFGTLFHHGTNVVSFTAISVLGKRSAPVTFSPKMAELPDWLAGLRNTGMLIGQLTFLSYEETSEIQFPKNPIKFNGGMLELQFKVGGSATISLRCDQAATFKVFGGLKLDGAKFKGIEFGGDFEIAGEAAAGMIECEMPTVEGSLKAKLWIYGKKEWPVPIFIAEFINPAVAQTLEELVGVIGVGEEGMKVFGQVYVKVGGLITFDSGFKLTGQDPYIDWNDVTFGLGPKIEAGYEFKAFEAEMKAFLSVSGTWTAKVPSLTRFDQVTWPGYVIHGQGGVSFKPPLLDCTYERVYSLKWTHYYTSPPPDSIEASLERSNDCSLFGGGKRASARFYGSTATPQAFSPAIHATRLSRVPERMLLQFDDQTASSLLVSNVYRRAEPVLAINPASHQAMMLWVQDDTTKPQYQSHEIAWSIWDGSAWSTPGLITRDSYLDGAPQVAWDANGNAVAVWTRLPSTLSEADTWNEATAKKFEIATATYDGVSEKWSAPALVTNNTALDLSPALSRSPAGELLLVWRQNEAGKLLGGPTFPDQIMTAAYQGGAWGTPSAVAEGVAGVGYLSAASDALASTIAFAQYVSPESGGENRIQVFTMTWDGSSWSVPVQRTNNDVDNRFPRLFYNATGQAILVWMAGSELQMHNLVTSTESTLSLSSDIGTVAEFQLVRDGNGNQAVTFVAQAATQRDLYLAFYDQQNNVWGSPRRLTDDSDSEFYPATALDSSGRLLASYVRTEKVISTQVMDREDGSYLVDVPVDGPSDLMTLSHEFNFNLSAGSLTVSNANPLAGETVTLSAGIHNTGDKAAAGVSVSFYNGDPAIGGELLGTAVLDQPLPAQSEAFANLDYTYPGEGPINLYALIDPEDSLVESNETDNQSHLALFLPDLAVVSASVEYWGASSYGLKATIVNLGSSLTAPAELHFFDPAHPEVDLASVAIPSLVSGESVSLVAPYQAPGLTMGSYPLMARINPGAGVEDGQVDNNQDGLTLEVQPNLSVSPYAVWIEDWSAEHKLAHVQVLNTGAVDAQNVVLNVYRNARQDPQALLATRTIPVLPAGQSQTLDIPIEGALPCGLYVLVNPGSTLAETTRADNLAKAVNLAGGSCPAETDWTPPEAPLVSEPSEGAALKTFTPTFIGTAEPGSLVTVSENGVILCSTTAVEEGQWSCQPLADMSEGSHTVTVGAMDAATNQSTPTQRSFILQKRENSIFLPMLRR